MFKSFQRSLGLQEIQLRVLSPYSPSPDPTEEDLKRPPTPLAVSITIPVRIESTSPIISFGHGLRLVASPALSIHTNELPLLWVDPVMADRLNLRSSRTSERRSTSRSRPSHSASDSTFRRPTSKVKVVSESSTSHVTLPFTPSSMS